MYIWFTQKASLMASMRKALLVLALSVVMLQMASLPAMAKQLQPGGGQTTTTTTTTTATQQDSVSPPPAANNDGGAANDNVASGGDSLTTTNNQQSNPPANKSVGIVADPVKDQGKGNVGIVADPVKDPSKDNAASKTGNTLIHCSPGVGCSTKEDLGVARKDDKSSSNSSSSSQQDPILIHCSPGKGCSTQNAPTTGGEAHGCFSNYKYDEDSGTCLPTLTDLGFFGVFSGDKPSPTTVGGVVSFLGDAPGDALIASGAVFAIYGGWLDQAASNWGNEIGGPVGDVVKGLGTGIGDTLEAVGGLLEGLGTGVEDASDAVGDAIDYVGDTAKDVVDTISDWF